MEISVVIPVYGCKTSLIELHHKIKSIIENITKDYEIILIDDDSPDEPWQIIKELSLKNKEVKGIRFSRNFGQHKAIFAGLEKSKGEWIIVMDCDLQDDPEEIPNLYFKIKEGYDIVLGKREIRKHSYFKQLFSKWFYLLLGYLTATKQDSSIANFGIYSRKVINAICKMNDTIKYFPTMVQWVGFSKTSIKIKHSERLYGKTTYSFKKLINLGMEVILAFSEKPLKLAVKTGVFISLLSFVFALFTLVRYILGGIKVSGYSSLIISIWFLSGIIIIILGIVGLYVGKTFEKVKDRPVYIIKEETENE